MLYYTRRGVRILSAIGMFASSGGGQGKEME